jgi:hypothetical protein
MDVKVGLTLREERILRMSVNRMLRIFGPESGEVAGDWRRQQNEELRNLYASLNIIRVTKSSRMRWTGHVAHMEGMRNAYKFWSESLNGRDNLEGLDVDGRTILEGILYN